MKAVSSTGLQIVERVFQQQKMLIHMGAKINKVQHGLVQLELPKSNLALQQHGFFHGGIIATLADTAAGLAGHSVLEHLDHRTITVELKINFLRPADGQSIISYGKLLKETRSLMVATAEVYTEDKLCAYMTQTIKKVFLQEKGGDISAQAK